MVRQTGFTLTELTVALVLGALVVLAATSMVVTSRATYRTQDEATRVAENGRFALELLIRMVRMAGYTDFGDSSAPPPEYSPQKFCSDATVWCSISTNASLLANGPNIVGTNNATVVGTLLPIGSVSLATSGPPNYSDALSIRYFGSGRPGSGADGNVLDCAGVAVPPAANVDPVQNLSNRDFNVLYIKNDSTNEPTLYCSRYTYDASSGAIGATSDEQALIRGVEAFHVLFGEDIYAHSAANPCGDPPSTPGDPPIAAGGDPDRGDLPVAMVYRTGIGGANPVVCWNHVTSLRIGLLLRSNVGAQPASAAMTYKLFGPSYPSSGDPGASFSTTALSASERTRIRRVVSTTVLVRNRMLPWPGPR